MEDAEPSGATGVYEGIQPGFSTWTIRLPSLRRSQQRRSSSSCSSFTERKSDADGEFGIKVSSLLE
jgi:hypothetical protein